MSGPALFQLVAEYRSTADRLADLDLDETTVRDTLEGMAGELEVKAQAVAAMCMNLRATADAIKAHREAQKDREDSIRRRADHLEGYLSSCLTAAGIQKVEGPGLCIGWRASSAVVIDEPDLIPAEYMRHKPAPPPEPDKTALAKAIKAGAEVPGARIEHRRNIAIK